MNLAKPILPEPIVIDPHSNGADFRIDTLPTGAGVYVIRMGEGTAHLSACAYLRARIKRLLAGSHSASKPGAHSASKQRLRDQVSYIECWPSSSRLETGLLLLQLGQTLYPRDYDRKLRLRRPWFVRLSSDRFARLLVLNRLPGDRAGFYGPFPTRETAAAYAEAAAGLFQIRKCADPLEPSPDHPGCIYGEMNQCLRPCQCVVSDEEYASEARRVKDFLQTNGVSTRTSLMLSRERASEELDFELASHLHKRLEKLASVVGLREDPAGTMLSFGGVAVTQSADPGTVRIWPMREAVWLSPVDLALAGGESRSLDARLREVWAITCDAAVPCDADASAHLAILLRWHRSSYRDGEWVQDMPGKGLSYRKVVGAISRLMKQ